MPAGQYAGGIASRTASGSAAAPGAGAPFVTLTAPPAGWYRISGWYAITGALEAAAMNVLIAANGAGILSSASGAGITAIVQYEIPQILLNGANNVTLQPVANATASTVYTGVVIATALAD